MKLKKLFLENIRSYEKEEINFPEGPVLLSGDIGSGKTSLLLAIEYALFGLQPGQKGSSLLRNNANFGLVSLELDIDGKNILIERRLKRKNKSVTNEYSAITINGEKSESSLTEIKTIILHVLGYPGEFIKKNNLLYRYTVYTPQEQMKQIILEDAEVRLNTLRYILGVDKYKRIKENLAILLIRLKEDSKILQGEIKTLDEDKAKIELKSELLKNLEKRITEKIQDLEAKTSKTEKISLESNQLESKIREKEYFEKEVEKTKIVISTKYENLSLINSDIYELKKNISESKEVFNEEEYKNILFRLSEKNSDIEKFNSEYLNLIAEINSMGANKEEALKKIDRIFKIEICPTCLQNVPESYKHNILNEIENNIASFKKRESLLEKKIYKLSEILCKERAESASLEKRKNSLEILRTHSGFLEKTKARLQHIQKTKQNLERDISLLEEHIENLKKQILELSTFDGLYKLKQKELKNSLAEEREAEIFLAELKKESYLIKKEIIDLENTINLKELSKTKLFNLLEVSNWLSYDFMDLIDFIERNILLKLRQEFSNVFSKWFHMLVPEAGFNVRLDESFSPLIMHKGIEMEYLFLSGGERTAIALAYRLALNQTVNSVLGKIKTKDIIMLDEPTDGFSEVQLDRMKTVLEELNISQLIIVSHEQKIESFVNDFIRIKKNGDVSYLERPSTYQKNSLPVHDAHFTDHNNSLKDMVV